MNVLEDSGTLLSHDVHNDVVGFDLSDESFIFDELLRDERQPAYRGEL